jgi:hypothetical protein
MAYGQIDPARLAGEALTRWYLRSPADIERERKAAAAQNYDDFFGGVDRTANPQDGTSIEQSSSDLDGTQSAQDGVRRWGLGGSPGDGVYRPAQGGVEKSAVAANVRNCVGCHQGLPPVPVPLPLVPLFRGIPSFPPSGQPPGSGEGNSAGNNPPQCAIQYDNDSNICRWLPGRDARRRCWESAAEREAYCIKSKGRVGSPPLITR